MNIKKIALVSLLSSTAIIGGCDSSGSKVNDSKQANQNDQNPQPEKNDSDQANQNDQNPQPEKDDKKESEQTT
ncbi:MAG: hypothetical protein C4617_05340 [Candidatus Liberibacter europaeus]|uniref:Lipoprotein n=1 Tax=Candidatus Liberibacter europaeus TaxID=744859 RepID=A0A2T4VWF5_9HYPH|nr:MAG: hypothetical protein C4617_05340 [Candidatus Liberibacter europaeus]